MNEVSTGKYFIYVGSMNSYGEIQEKEAVGIAFQKKGSNSFRVKLWMFHSTPYMLVPQKEDRTKYDLFSVEENKNEGKLKGFWNKIGSARLHGNYLKVRIPLLPEFVYLSLFPSARPEQNYKDVA